ncbi:NUDIX hydrolase [Paenibacillus hodogayensis]|uniref:NUDIX hydrolase n=1 Tax=Paenibacillus hodogayensis TaxID=279208 RepID=A0ABV5W342_9BACL
MNDQEYAYCPVCGTALTGTYVMGKSYRHCPEGHYTFYPGQSVGAVALLAEQGNILLERRAIEPGYGMWALPGGMAERGESMEQCMMREVFEETGLLVEPVRLLDALGGKHVCTVFYEARLVGGQLVKSDESMELRWFAPEEIPLEQIAFPRHKDMLLRWLGLSDKGGE